MAVEKQCEDEHKPKHPLEDKKHLNEVPEDDSADDDGGSPHGGPGK